MAEWTENLHPRAPAGGPTGGQFIAGGGDSQATGGWLLDDADLKEISGYKRWSKREWEDTKYQSELPGFVYNLSAQEENALMAYSLDSWHLNPLLRQGVTMLPGYDQQTQEGGLSYQVLKDNLDALIQRGKLDEDTVLHRQIAVAEFDQHLGKLKPGDVVTDPAFMSTSIIPAYWDEGRPSTHYVNMEILAPEGTPCVYTGSIIEGGGDETEVILPRNAQLEYMGERKDGARVFKLKGFGEAKQPVQIEHTVLGVGIDKPLIRSVNDFTKDNVSVDDMVVRTNRTEQLIKEWNDNVHESPAKFHSEFVGGLSSTMQLGFGYGGGMLVVGDLLDDKQQKIGVYESLINWQNKSAHEELISLRGTVQHKGMVKALMAGHIATYQKLGLKKVDLFANLDVGGYAWAKYGFVPDAHTWEVLSGRIKAQLTRDLRQQQQPRATGRPAEQWEDYSPSQQRDIETDWRNNSYSEFLQGEVEDWYRSGEALNDTKALLAERKDWVSDVLYENFEMAGDTPARTLTEGAPKLPYSRRTLLNAIQLNYDHGGGDEGELTVKFDDAKLREPVGVDANQPMLPGMEIKDKSQYLSNPMRADIIDKINERFEQEAADRVERTDPPDYIQEAAREVQDSVWEDMADSERVDWANHHGWEIPETRGVPEEDLAEPEPSDDQRALFKILDSKDPKAIWALADSKWGKQALLGRNWDGALEFGDAESMKRFNDYVGQAGTGASKAPSAETGQRLAA